MPLARREATTKRRGWTPADRRFLDVGHHFFGETCFAYRCSGACLAGVPSEHHDAMRAGWADLGAEIMAKRLQERPGTRPWFWWVFLVLPDNPRLPMVDEPTSPGTVQPFGYHAWESDGHESSLAYVLRRGLLEPGELARLRAKEADAARQWLTYRRMRRDTDHCIPAHPVELAAVGIVWGADLLTADELHLARAHLGVLRRYLEAADKS